MQNKDDELLSSDEFIAQNLAWMRNVSFSELKDKGCTYPEGHADEVVNDICARLLENWISLYSPEAALYRITVNAARTHARSCRREEAREIDESTVPVFAEPGQDPEVIASRAEYIRHLMSLLNKDEQDVIEMRFFYELSFSAIAARLEKPQGTVSSMYSRALKKLKRAISPPAGPLVRSITDEVGGRVGKNNLDQGETN